MNCASSVSYAYVLILLILIVSASAQYNWNCNHWSAYTVDVCYQYSSTYQYLYQCNTTDSMVLLQYTGGTCGETDADAFYSVTYKESSDTSDIFQCDQSGQCNYAILRYYTDEDCSGDTYLDGPFVTGQCYTSSATSFQVSCGTDTLTVETYLTAGNCTGSSVSSTINYADYSEGRTGCYQVAFLPFFQFLSCFFFFSFCFFFGFVYVFCLWGVVWSQPNIFFLCASNKIYFCIMLTFAIN